jgi:hypothetical protein
VTQAICKKMFPAIEPGIILREIAIVCCAMKSELALW